MVSHGGRGVVGNNRGETGVGLGGLHVVLKKGPWTAAEDAVLLDYVRRQGEGNWNAVQQNTSLQRCGKSCRLRWANHLRPCLKKGPFTPEEEKTIIDLHAKIGNKWARMAAQLPGRTDNEIKNYWNTRLKRRHRANLPVYPMELLQQQFNHCLHQKPPQNMTVSPSSSFASIISAAAAAASSSTCHQNHQHSRLNRNSVNFMNLHEYPPYRNNMNPSRSFPSLRQVNNNDLTSGNGFSYQNGELFNQALSEKSPSFNLGLNAGHDPVSTSTTNTASFDPVGLLGMGTGNNNELSSIQNTIQTSNNSGYTGSDDVKGVASSDGDEEYDKVARGSGSTGLLGDLLEESQTIKRNKYNSEKNIKAEYDGLSEDTFQAFKAGKMNGLSNPKHEASSGAFISGTHSTIGMNGKAEAIEEMNNMEDDLLRLLDCPSPVCIPDWYEGGSSTNNSNYSSREPSNIAIAHRDVPSLKADDDDDWDESICCWNNDMCCI